ncbi:MAG: DNRLRE domain-containing protein [Terriglobales bacterium]
MTNSKIGTLWFSVILVSLFAWTAHAQITPLGDSYINTSAATTNYGSKTLLDVDGASQTTYIQFNLGSIPATASVSQATLKLYVNSVTAAGSFNVDYVNAAWSEGKIDASNAPPLGAAIASNISVTTADKNQYILVNVTSAVQAWLNGSETNNGLALVANSSFNAAFDSKENTTTSHPAELDIAFAGGDGTITGVETSSSSGLTGGGTSGTLNLSLLTGCASNQVLQWSGSEWKCSNAGTGTITGVTAGSDLTGGGTSGNVTLNLNTANVPLLAANNSFTGNQTVNGSLTATGFVSAAAISAAASNGSYAVTGNDSSSSGSIGVAGISANGTGVYGSGVTGTSGIGVTYGVYASASNGDGIVGLGAGTYNSGVYGSASGSSGNGVYGNGVTGVWGNGSSYGLYGSGGTYGMYSQGSSYGVYGYGPTAGVYAVSNTGDGVYTKAGTGGIAADVVNTGTGYGLIAGSGGWAAWFNGNVDVDGNLSKAGGSFKIDDPLDPENKYLYHSFVESPDMMNIYNGNVTTDAQGDAVVSLPEWFETLNRDFRYQLTVMGQFSQAIVASKVANHQFAIKTDKPNVEVSWQVTGIRQDAWANAHRIPVEEEKPEVERGFYLHPELYGAPEEKGVLWANAPKAMKQWKEARTKAATSDGNEVLTNPGNERPQPLSLPPAPTSSSLRGPS